MATTPPGGRPSTPWWTPCRPTARPSRCSQACSPMAVRWTLHTLVDPLSAYGETLAVFTSVLAYGGAMVALKHNNRTGVLFGLGAAFILGAVFLGLEVQDFAQLFHAGIYPQDSGYLSAFFALVMTHGLHMAFGLLWMAVLFVQVATQGFTDKTVYRLLNLKLFWHFQAVIWVLVFTFVDLRGML
ncbi:hypothetical protein C4901_06130 [Acidiferrobacter sp. SPIII_3]|nr:hypothetical protein C4901_06130 [Acidiferrobacter sp. SPIII_3]